LIPRAWDDVRFIDGYPGKYVVMARKGGGHWYVAGINAGDEAKELSLNLSEISKGGRADLIADGDGGNLSFRHETVQLDPAKPIRLSIRPRGGFLMTLD
jgi:hypothetical protein